MRPYAWTVSHSIPRSAPGAPIRVAVTTSTRTGRIPPRSCCHTCLLNRRGAGASVAWRTATRSGGRLASVWLKAHTATCRRESPGVASAQGTSETCVADTVIGARARTCLPDGNVASALTRWRWHQLRRFLRAQSATPPSVGPLSEPCGDRGSQRFQPRPIKRVVRPRPRAVQERRGCPLGTTTSFACCPGMPRMHGDDPESILRDSVVERPGCVLDHAATAQQSRAGRPTSPAHPEDPPPGPPDAFGGRFLVGGG